MRHDLALGSFLSDRVDPAWKSAAGPIFNHAATGISRQRPGDQPQAFDGT